MVPRYFKRVLTSLDNRYRGWGLCITKAYVLFLYPNQIIYDLSIINSTQTLNFSNREKKIAANGTRYPFHLNHKRTFVRSFRILNLTHLIFVLIQRAEWSAKLHSIVARSIGSTTIYLSGLKLNHQTLVIASSIG